MSRLFLLGSQVGGWWGGECVCVCMCVFSCVQLFHDPIDCSPHGFCVHAVAQPRILE